MIDNNQRIEKDRMANGEFASDISCGNNGAFRIYCPLTKKVLFVIVSDGEGWDHVSVSMKNRTPAWIEMCFIKDIFWSKDEVVIQYHPREVDYINVHEHCLHMWRSQSEIMPKPHLGLV